MIKDKYTSIEKLTGIIQNICLFGVLPLGLIIAISALINSAIWTGLIIISAILSIVALFVLLSKICLLLVDVVRATHGSSVDMASKVE